MAAILQPSYLKKGDLVTLVAPASAFERDLFEKGVTFLEDFGLRVDYHPSIFLKAGYLAGPDAKRLQNLFKALSDKRSKAVWVARGGYGSLRLLLSPKARLPALPPKVVIGMSDVTCLLNWIPRRFGVSTVHGPVLAGQMLHSFSRKTQQALLGELFEPQAPQLVEGKDYHLVRSGKAKAPLVGGNLAMIEASLGTPWEVSTRGSILFLEDIHEPPYKIDRMLTHLALSGKFKSIKGLLLGEFFDPKGQSHDPKWLRRLLLSLLPKGIPILDGLRIGHKQCAHLLSLGQPVSIGARGKTLRLSPCVSHIRD